ncbi:CRISPR-associated helicase Cas3' [Specibacter cremeus]|uniref:CRISPR-associated helicase Cas3' n=1 Tax=Specibacter cremeus TaxID=1629051 RepID=UPI000F77B85F|nr:CRISPR-associated helicase Cas3' [Specibacter cremeus]
MISAAAQSVWAKFDRDTQDSMPLYQHMRDSAGVAGKLWDEWLPASVKRQIGTAIGADGDAEARTLAVWLACIHDIGKAHPLFAHQVEILTAPMRRHGLSVPTSVTPEQRIPHSVLSHVIARTWLCDGHGFSRARADSYAVVPGGHHGVAPDSQVLKKAKDAQTHLDARWHAVQRELLDDAAAFTGTLRYLPRWRDRGLSPQAQLLLTAVVIVADWIASNTDYFPLWTDGPDTDRVERAWRGIGLISPWHVDALPDTTDRLITDRFDLPPGSTPNAMQTAAVDAAQSMNRPGLLVIEAAMGEGKTEAALAAAEVFAAKWGFGGVMIGLPTQATSDGMFTRVVPWVNHQAEIRGPETCYSVNLAHSKAGLNADLSAMPRARSIRSVYDDEFSAGNNPPAAVAHEWLFGRKKGLLADFVVGTVDQILFAALQSKHVVLRHLGLAGKAVIIDEVHAYDAYMGVYLQRALHWLAAYSVPVILLSATLPAGIRRELVDAYESGRPTITSVVAPTGTRRRRSSTVAAREASLLDGNPGYPLVIASGGATVLRAPGPSGPDKEVEVRVIDDDLASLLTVLQPVKEQGGCVGIVCNTVRRAQAMFEALSQHFPDDELILDHSRFMAPDRTSIESRIRTVLGPDAAVAAAGAVRPPRLIVVGTQVLEQSLDIDFDLLVTDFAPADLLLQRIGRLHRRRSPVIPRAAHVKDPVCVVRGVKDWAAEPPTFDDGSTVVYGRAVLLRTAAVLRERINAGERLRVPTDIPDIVQACYGDGIQVPDAWREDFDAAEAARLDQRDDKQQRAQAFLLDKPGQFSEGLAIDLLTKYRGNADSGDGAAEARATAQVRDIDESLEVILAYRNDGLRFLPHVRGHGDRLLPEDVAPENDVARSLSACTVRLPGQLCRWGRIDRVLDELERDGIAAWQRSRWLKGQLVLVLDENLSAVVDGTRVTYDPRVGLTCGTEGRDEA